MQLDLEFTFHIPLLEHQLKVWYILLKWLIQKSFKNMTMEKGNLIQYNQTTPPEYQLENITAKVALLWAENDKLADPEDVHYLEGRLKNLIFSKPVNLKQFNHLDFVWGMDANVLVYEDVLTLLEKHS
ncbi:lipase [Caerostris extrusa]|uniref:Lipase n=1 Tax=Caerostris extrusa TaxID=172846 RepID=A0AAV4V335_CAEEX|nr:lipase [Caerostris extrusa]